MISTSRLIELCRRVATSIHAGLEARRVWEIEATRGTAKDREVLRGIFQQVANGGSLADAFRESGYFPSLVVEMVKVGEQTGHLDQIFGHLGEHYENFQRQTRNFLLGIAWPMLELFVAVCVIGLVIWLPTALSGQRIDILRIGLAGTDGVIIYFTLVAGFVFLLSTLIYAVYRGWFGSRPILMARRIPLLGRCLECLALARCTWALAMAHEAGMSAESTAKLALGASQHPLYRRSTRTVIEVLAKNESFHAAFVDASVFPTDFLDAIHTGELTGTITETLTRKSRDYDQESQRLLAQITMLLGALVFFLVGCFIVAMIFRLAMTYINLLNGLANDGMNAPLLP